MLPVHTLRLDSTTMDYPPASPAGSSAARHGRMASLAVPSGSRMPAFAPPEHSLVHRLLGPRGAAALTIDTEPAPASSASAAQLRVEQREARRRSMAAELPQPARWATWEYRLYAAVVCAAVPYMVYVPVQLSQPSAPNFLRYRSHLRQGWLFGRLRDDSDFQYKTFREHFPLLAVLLVVYCSLSWLSSRLGGGKAAQVPSLRSSGHSQSTAAPQRRFFLTVFTTVFVVALHGSNALKLGLVLLINYTIARSFGGTRVAPVLIWTFNIGTLAAVHWNDGFPWRDLSWQLGWLDDYAGLLPRWQINFNISMLRLVSFALDLHWARQAPPKLYEPEPEPRKRAATSLAQEKYSLGQYLLYVCYPPLFIAGPIMGFNDFVRQLDNPPRLTRASRISYAVRFVACLLTMEFVLHYIYVNAIKDSKAWAGSTPMELSMIGFWNLIIVWLKLLIPWRFFRLWALLDGVEPPENMVRCMANNYSTMGFWRSWHRSYNLWTVRYIYVPVGGSKNLIPATLLVFTFVALWHDLSLKLLTWGWLVSLFILPELAAAALLPAKRFGTQWWYRHVCAFGGVLNVLLMMTANLVGFAIGTDGMKYMWQELLGTWNGLRFLAAACCALYCAVHIMFEYRAEELRHGIARKC